MSPTRPYRYLPTLLSVALVLLPSCAASDSTATASSGGDGAGGSAFEGGLPDAQVLPGADSGDQGDGGNFSGMGGSSGSGGSSSAGAAGTAGSGGSSSAGAAGSGGSSGCTPEDETCNNKDDDCDGVVDSFDEKCSTACGSGKRTCTKGKWGSCSAPAPVNCLNYKTCKKQDMCVSSCPSAPSESCNLIDDDCDGHCDEGAGCRIAVNEYHKTLPGGVDYLYETGSSEASAAGYSLRRSSLFYLYKYPGAGLVPFYRCLLNGGFHFYTVSGSCEAANKKPEKAIGYIGTSSQCNAMPLHRLYKSGGRIYTTSVIERDQLVSGGFTYEGKAGQAWR